MSGIFHGTDPMSDVISDDYRMLQIISRFGITLGFGDKTVAETCKAAGVDTPTFLTVVNFHKDTNHAHMPEMVESISLPSLLAYLKNSHTYFTDYRLPAIRRKLIEAINYSTHSQIAMLIIKFYDEYATEVSNHMQYENTRIHPFVETLLQGLLPKERFTDIITNNDGSHSGIEKSLTELKNIIIKYYPNDTNAALLNEVLMDIYMVEEDLLNHCHLEDTLFVESVRALERDVIDRGGEIVEPQPAETETSSTNDLSEREKEVIRLVAMGLSNKEIAERMFIAVNTVMTHRRNISRKLDIHAAAGLTIYAIVNGLINVEDVKL